MQNTHFEAKFGHPQYHDPNIESVPAAKKHELNSCKTSRKCHSQIVWLPKPAAPEIKTPPTVNRRSPPVSFWQQSSPQYFFLKDLFDLTRSFFAQTTPTSGQIIIGRLGVSPQNWPRSGLWMQIKLLLFNQKTNPRKLQCGAAALSDLMLQKWWNYKKG